MRQLPEKIDSKFRFVLLAAKRAEMLMRGAQSKIELHGARQTRVGMEEIFEEAVEWDYGPEPVIEDDEIGVLGSASEDEPAA